MGRFFQDFPLNIALFGLVLYNAPFSPCLRNISKDPPQWFGVLNLPPGLEAAVFMPELKYAWGTT